MVLYIEGMDAVQGVLLFVILILATLLLILGVQVLLILRDLRTTIAKANRVLENTEFITESVSEPISFISGLLSGGKTLSDFLRMVRRKKEKKEEEDGE